MQEVHHEQGFPIYLLCDLIGISKSSYYKWLNRISTEEDQLNASLLKSIQQLYENVKDIYGYRRMAMNMERKFNRPINEKRIYRLMRIADLKAVIRRKKTPYKRSFPQHIEESQLNREFTADAPNQKWLTDVSEFKYGSNHKAYLSVILDLHDKSIVAFELGTSNNNPLVFDTFHDALTFNKESEPLIHSDRGYQYTSLKFKEMIDSHNMKHSMSRIGRCIDNGPMEGFFGILKSEEYYLSKQKYETYDELKQAIEKYIHFYNYDKSKQPNPIEYRGVAV